MGPIAAEAEQGIRLYCVVNEKAGLDGVRMLTELLGEVDRLRQELAAQASALAVYERRDRVDRSKLFSVSEREVLRKVLDPVWTRELFTGQLSEPHRMALVSLTAMVSGP
jgi:hypothetical protein